MQRIISLDVGERRIGVAVSDPMGWTAQGVETIQHHSYRESVDRILSLAKQYGTNRIVCGLPRNLKGEEGAQAEYTRNFAGKLEKAGMEVRFQDERMTSVMAESALLAQNVHASEKRKYVDKVAAVLILQTFLDAGGWKEEKPKIRLGGRYRMSEENNMRDVMNPEDEEQEQENIVELVDEDGQAVSFEHLMTLEHNGKIYICLVPLEEMEDVEEDELVILRVETDDEGNDVYTSIDDEQELNEVYEKYLEIAEADE